MAFLPRPATNPLDHVQGTWYDAVFMSNNNAVTKTLYMPQFEVPPGPDGELDPVVCTEFTHERAAGVAAQIIAVMGKMEVNELSSDLLTLAFAYISRQNQSK